jgi:predicted RNA-binding Zn-ribbon protein involved in translation (DUF1610 family)
MYIFKSCPKCHGDLTLEQDEYSRRLGDRNTDFVCLQCGYRLVPRERRQIVQRLAAKLAA